MIRPTHASMKSRIAILSYIDIIVQCIEEREGANREGSKCEGIKVIEDAEEIDLIGS